MSNDTYTSELLLEQVIEDNLNKQPARPMYKTTRTLGRFTKALGRTAKSATRKTAEAIASTAKEAKKGLSDGWNS